MASIFQNIVTDTDFFAVYTKTIKFTVVWKDWDGEVLKTESVKNGSGATPPDNPIRSGYRFSKWNAAYSSISSDLEITAEYIKTWTVVYKDSDGTELKTQVVDNGGSVTPPSNPTKDGYTFSKWSHDGKNITSNLDITAIYVQISLNVTAYSLNGGKQEYRNIESLYLLPVNFGVHSIYSVSNITNSGNKEKIGASYGGSEISLSLCDVTLGNNTDFMIDKSTGIITRVLGDKMECNYATSLLTIEYNGLKKSITVSSPAQRIVFTIDTSKQGVSGAGWYELHPTVITSSGVVTDIVYTKKEDLSQFTPKFNRTDTGATLTQKIVAGEPVDIYTSYHYEVYIPSSIPSSSGIYGTVELKQTTANGFKNAYTTEFDAGGMFYKGEIGRLE